MQDQAGEDICYLDLEDDEIAAIEDIAELLSEQGSPVWQRIWAKLNADEEE
jgi:hypothetical protein